MGSQGVANQRSHRANNERIRKSHKFPFVLIIEEEEEFRIQKWHGLRA